MLHCTTSTLLIGIFEHLLRDIVLGAEGIEVSQMGGNILVEKTGKKTSKEINIISQKCYEETKIGQCDRE